MSVLPIITGADSPVLRTKTKRVERLSKEILKLIDDMKDTTDCAEGLGLAAPQIGQSLRLCVVRMNGKLIPLINPDIFWKSEDQEVAEEGCLSLPNVWVQVPRSVAISVRYLDGKGKEQERRLERLEARIVQHEVDHLDGTLIVDYGMHGKPL